MIVVAVCNTKGGGGKTTLALALAVRAAQDSGHVVVVDLDPQKSMVALFERRGASDNPTVLDADSAAKAVKTLARQGAEWVFIDGPPAFLTALQETIAEAHFTLIPIRASMIDLHATQDAVALAREAGTPFLCVLNDCQPREKLADSARAMLTKAGVPTAETQIMHRVSHIGGATLGRSAAEVNGGRDKAATGEIDALWQEVKKAATKSARARAKREAGQ